jgi:hypothetical protein
MCNIDFIPPKPLENVTSDGKTRQNQARKRSLGYLNEHFEPGFNAVLPSEVVFMRPLLVGYCRGAMFIDQRTVMETVDGEWFCQWVHFAFREAGSKHVA